MLSAAVEYRHDNADTVSLTACSLDYSLEILEMIVGRHSILMTEVVILYVIISYVNDYEKVFSADGRLDKALSVT